MQDEAFSLCPPQWLDRPRSLRAERPALHVGGGRTALFNYLFAHGRRSAAGGDGRFLLRIEDTDRNRLVEGATEGIFDILTWFGLTWDEGPDVGGDHGPYTQSERTALYTEAADRLLAEGNAYRCFCTPERLQAVREAQQAKGSRPATTASAGRSPRARSTPTWPPGCRTSSASPCRATARRSSPT
jgi:glutamyl/glutaminyl-tRNA synthetase